MQYRVSYLKHLKIIINYFYQFPLITNKFADFKFFKLIFDLVQRHLHFNDEGLRQILEIKASMKKQQLSD